MDAIISRATEAAAAASAAAALEAEAAQAAAAAKLRSKNRSKSGSKEKKEKSKPQDNNKKLLKLVGEVVVKYMSRYRDNMDHETFKKHAKEVRPFTPIALQVTNNYPFVIVDPSDRREGDEVVQLSGRKGRLTF